MEAEEREREAKRKRERKRDTRKEKRAERNRELKKKKRETVLNPRFVGSNQDGIDGFFQSVEILSMTSYGREVKPWVPCRRFTARKRTSSRN